MDYEKIDPTEVAPEQLASFVCFSPKNESVSPSGVDPPPMDSGLVDSTDPIARVSKAHDLEINRRNRTLQFCIKSLRQAGFEKARVSYDGGGDEGFAQFHSAQLGEDTFGHVDVIELLDKSPLADPQLIPHAVQVDQRESVVDMRRRWERGVRVREWLEQFAYDVTAVLMSETWGTGTVYLRGICEIDLESGELGDLELDCPPDFADELDWLWDKEEDH